VWFRHWVAALAQQSVPADGGVVIRLHGPVQRVQEEFTTKGTKGIGRSSGEDGNGFVPALRKCRSLGFAAARLRSG